jgi:hypothetical protein
MDGSDWSSGRPKLGLFSQFGTPNTVSGASYRGHITDRSERQVQLPEHLLRIARVWWVHGVGHQHQLDNEARNLQLCKESVSDV